MRYVLGTFEDHGDYKPRQSRMAAVKGWLYGKLGEYQTSDDTGCAPCSEDETVNLSDVSGTEGISRKGRHHRESTPRQDSR